MIVARELKDVSDFEALKKGDIVAVEWRRNIPISYRSEKTTRFATYTVTDNLSQQTEIILQRPMNIYFNYMMFVEPNENGVSNVRSITLLTAEDV